MFALIFGEECLFGGTVRLTLVIAITSRLYVSARLPELD
jgi:hypothetical protein